MSILILLVVFVKVSSDLLGPEIVIAERDSSVKITCRYDLSPVNIHGRKFWCKLSGALTGCSTIVSSTPYVVKPGYKNRTRLVDSPANGTFQVEMADLTREDGGQYRCGIGPSNGGFFSNVFLAISEGPNMTDHLELVSGELHGSISVRCSFPESRNKKMYWCKMRRTGACRILADTEGYVEERHVGRLHVTPEGTAGVANILTSRLTPEDAGWYRCGTGTFRSGGRWKDVQVVVLTVSATASVLDSQMTVTSPFPRPTSMEEKRSPYSGTTIGTTDVGAMQGSSIVVPASNLPLSFASTPQDYVSGGNRSPLVEVSKGSIHEGITQNAASKTLTSAADPAVTTGWRSVSRHLTQTAAAAEEESVKESTMRLSTAPTDETRASASPMDSRGSSQSPPSKRSFTRNSDDPERGVSDAHLVESSNSTYFKEGSLRSNPSLLLVLVPSLLLGLLLIAAGFFVVTKARCMRHRVRQPVNENRTQVALEETRCLQKSAEGDGPNRTGDKETDVDYEEVPKGLMEKASLDTYLEAAVGVDL